MNLQNGDIFLIGFAIINSSLIIFSGLLSRVFFQINNWYLNKYEEKTQDVGGIGPKEALASNYSLTKNKIRITLILSGSFNIVGLIFLRFYFMPFLEN